MSTTHTRSLEELESALGVTFRAKSFLEHALTHCSYEKAPDNKALLFLGRYVIQLVLAEFAFHRADESTVLNASEIVHRLGGQRAITAIAANLNLQPFILLGRGIEKQDPVSTARQRIASEVLEAIVGALYLDQGLDECQNFLDRIVLVKADEILTDTSPHPKTALQTLTFRRWDIEPHYKILEETGPLNRRFFAVGVSLGHMQLAIGKGYSRKDAEADAAQVALNSVAEWEGMVVSRRTVRMES